MDEEDVISFSEWLEDPANDGKTYVDYMAEIDWIDADWFDRWLREYEQLYIKTPKTLPQTKGFYADVIQIIHRERAAYLEQYPTKKGHRE